MRQVERRLPVGAETQPGGGVHFRVWSPDHKQAGVVVERSGSRTVECPLAPERCGYLSAFIEDAAGGDRYWISLEDDRLPDPASRYQPDGPFGASQIVDPTAFAWTDTE